MAIITSCAQTKATYNLDFEEVDKASGLPYNWGLGNVGNASIPTDSTITAYKLDDKVKQHGKYSLLIDWDGHSDGWTASNYVIKRRFKGKKIKLTGYLKTEDVTEMAGLWMRIDGSTGAIAFDNMQSRPVKGTTAWKQYTIELDYDEEEAKQIVVGGLIVGKGKMWMDNLAISIDGKDIAQATAYTKEYKYKADLDTAYSKASGIRSIDADAGNIKTLTNLGMLWGFIKYYHANVNAGDHNMDAELFRVLPKVLAAKTTAEANAVMDNWVDLFGKPAPCVACADIKPTLSTKLMPDYGYLFDNDNLPGALIGKLTNIKRNRSATGQHYYIAMSEGVGNPVFKNEEPYADAVYPDAGMRLLALYRYWNMVQYFFPNRHLIGEDWKKVLAEFIPVFCNAKNALEYQLACKRLIARINDTHADVWSGANEIDAMRKDLQLPFELWFVDGKLVVTGVDDRVKDKLALGAVVEQIDGVPIDTLLHKYLPITPASNYETQLRNMADSRSFLFAGKEGDVRLTVNNLGLRFEVVVQRSKNYKRRYAREAVNAPYKMLSDNIGYIYAAAIAEKDVDKVKQTLRGARGIVVDMRCYPNMFVTFALVDWFKEKASPFVTFTMGNQDIPGIFTKQAGPEIGGEGQEHYKGKIVIIVNEETQSSAEYQTMALSTTPGSVVVGNTTAGADGNVSEIVLPGGLHTMFSGIGILYPDGIETQRKGIKIDHVVKPTIKGIREGRDEQLEEAVKIIRR